MPDEPQVIGVPSSRADLSEPLNNQDAEEAD